MTQISPVEDGPFTQLIKRLPKSHLDPVARIAALFEVIARGFPRNFESDSLEFQVRRRAVMLLLHDVNVPVGLEPTTYGL